ncbi:hypothetical protein [Leptospira sp. mild_001]|uniref:hypothetical protein n=1 Tax=Leptospira sp. mild_001 TaxID=2838238 RepID=UPI001E517072|nr:hypothetical protein [Leptospira sp. mild_001]
MGTATFYFRQNGAPSGLENRGLDARFAFTTKQDTGLLDSVDSRVSHFDLSYVQESY